MKEILVIETSNTIIVLRGETLDYVRVATDDF